LTIRYFPPRTPKQTRRSGTYTRDAARVRREAIVCALCGQPFTDPADPVVCHQIIARSQGGSDQPSNLAGVHASCNGRQGRGLQDP
jgi:5-methylcytosine-specific restriction endonuclease McrA